MSDYKIINKSIFAIFSLVMAATVMAGSAFAKAVDQRITVKDADNVIIENMRGKVTIVGTSNQEVWVVGRLDEKSTEFIFEQQGKDVVVKVKMPSHVGGSFWNSESEESNLLIEIPGGLNVDFSGVSTDVEISNVNADVNLNNVSGKVLASQLTGEINVQSVSGNVKTTALSGSVTLSTVSGNIIDKGSKGDLRYHAVSGDVNATSDAEKVKASVVSGDMILALAKVVELSMNTVSGDIDGELDLSDDGIVKFSTVSGNVSLALNESLNADITIRSDAGGRLINKLNDTPVDKAKHGPSSRLDTVVGSGGGVIKASTVSGRIKLSYQ
ncbi:DUF4097 family beta strand repeat-containing protein [Thalassotalea crassostreae]|uniref:DUF4097 family beta strand repeat-containing protein n=1 Tax=Thalassotalea crassostreae TaxID=1763536 RepID=UPI0008389976|nr:DUF4097 family beta strand repeat-containing protein [Thalassotalea crassostreae]